MKIYQGEELPEPKSMLEVSFSFLNNTVTIQYFPLSMITVDTCLVCMLHHAVVYMNVLLEYYVTMY